MVTTIAKALAQVKADLPQRIEKHVKDYLAAHPARRRQRLLDPLTTTLLFLSQILHGNTAINHLRHLVDSTFSASAYCRARGRLPLAMLQQLCAAITGDLLTDSDAAARWRGHRVWRADGSSFSMPDTPALQKHFGQPGAQKKGCGFPTATLLVLCNKAGLIARTIALPLRTHEASQISQLHPHLQPGDLLVYDRAGCSFTHLAQLFLGKFHGILRMHQRQIVSFRCGRRHAGQYPKGQQKGKPKSQWLARLGHWDQLVRWYKPAQRPQWLSAAEYEALPAELTVRELRFQVCRRGCRTRMITLVTSPFKVTYHAANVLK